MKAMKGDGKGKKGIREPETKEGSPIPYESGNGREIMGTAPFTSRMMPENHASHSSLQQHVLPFSTNPLTNTHQM